MLFCCILNLSLYFCKVINNEKQEVMRFLHYVIDEEGNQIEGLYSATNTPKFSLECLAKIKKGIYQIWDRKTNKIKIL